MHERLLDLLACPSCGAGFSIDSTDASDDGEILEGRLVCQACGLQAPVRRGIPRFVDDQADADENLGDQWREWGRVRFDRFSAHHLSERRFRRETGWSPEWMHGKVVLDAGCGAGRFADVAAGFGAEVVAVDISGAIDACRENLAVHGARVHPIQASLLALPLRNDVFDAAYCIEVVQHTPDPRGVIRRLISRVRPGGRFTVSFYERDFRQLLQPFKYALRLFTPHLKGPALLALCQRLVAIFFPVTAFLGKIPSLRIVNHLIPIRSVHDIELTEEQQRIWTLLDTVDWYGPRHEDRQKHAAIARLLKESGMIEVQSASGLVRATKRLV